MHLLKTMLFTFISLIGFVLGSGIFIGYMISAPGHKGEKSGHFNGVQFENKNQVKAKGIKDLIKWTMNRDKGPWYEISDVKQFEVSNDRPDSTVRIYYINHNTFLIQADGLNILTDPVWSKRASPFSWAGPKRMRPPGIKFEDLPPIDLVLISHNHYDHLDISTIKRLNFKYQPAIITPLGVSHYLNNQGVRNSMDMDWWDIHELTGTVSIHCVPAQHFSGRGLFDRDQTLWAGYIIQLFDQYIYFAGDTGYSDYFKQIGKRFSPIKAALLPIGAYLPRWFMSPVHTSPEDAVMAHIYLKAEKSIGMHYGTFPLGDDGMKQPEIDLKKAKEKYKSENFVILNEGSYMDFYIKPE